MIKSNKKRSMRNWKKRSNINKKSWVNWWTCRTSWSDQMISSTAGDRTCLSNSRDCGTRRSRWIRIRVELLMILICFSWIPNTKKDMKSSCMLKWMIWIKHWLDWIINIFISAILEMIRRPIWMYFRRRRSLKKSKLRRSMLRSGIRLRLRIIRLRNLPRGCSQTGTQIGQSFKISCPK